MLPAIPEHRCVQKPFGPGFGICGIVHTVSIACIAVFKPLKHITPTLDPAHAEYGARLQRPSLPHTVPGSVHVFPEQHAEPVVPHAVQTPPAHESPLVHAGDVAQHACPTVPHPAQIDPAPHVSPTAHAPPGQQACPVFPHDWHVPPTHCNVPVHAAPVAQHACETFPQAVVPEEFGTQNNTPPTMPHVSFGGHVLPPPHAR
jgi:hypothetical protein